MSTTAANPTDTSPEQHTTSDSKPPSSKSAIAKPSFFTIPPPIKAVFDTFPLKTYPSNTLPARSQRPDGNILYIWKEPWDTSAEAESEGPWRGSCNPGCLKFEAYLRFLSIPYASLPSNNHASPSGALPFLLAPSASSTTSTSPTTTIPSPKLREWALKHSTQSTTSFEKELEDPLLEARLSLLEHRIRRAWLYTLHLTPLFETLTVPLYITTASSNTTSRNSSSPPTTTPSTSLLAITPVTLVSASLASNLHTSATTELQKSTPVIHAATILADAAEAFDALETFLSTSPTSYFSGAETPGWLDACVFAYTGLLDREDGTWKGLAMSELGILFRAREGLVAHRRRIIEQYFSP